VTSPQRPPLPGRPLPGHGRFRYVPLKGRPDYSWPGGKRLAVWVALNVETFGFGLKGPTFGNPLPWPDHRNWCWLEYGNRVGIWHMLDMADQFGIPLGHHVNSYLYDTHPEIMDALGKRPRDEIMGHGRTNSEEPGQRPEAEERALIAEATAAITVHEGKAPAGWMTPLQAESLVTPDLLKEAGYRYMVDWPCDDQPFHMTTRAGPLLNVPYAVETNDYLSVIHLRQDAPVYEEVVIRQYEELLAQSVERPLVFAISLHTFIMGQPHRLRTLRNIFRRILEHRDFGRVWLTTPGAIADHCLAMKPGIIPGS
jgi:peptidoglycan/xylan/chitin deacetylase (PgdA/CDA1 family)